MHCGVHLDEVALTEATVHRLFDEEVYCLCSKQLLVRSQANRIRCSVNATCCFPKSEVCVFETVSFFVP